MVEFSSLSEPRDDGLVLLSPIPPGSHHIHSPGSKFQAGQHPLPNNDFSFSILQYINQRKKHRERWVGALMSTSVPRE